MRKLVAVALALALTPFAASAQTGIGTVNASATILANLTVNNVADLDFGSMSQGTGATLTPGVVPGAGTLGVIEIIHNSDVTIAVTPPATLTGPGAPIPVVFNCGYSTGAAAALEGAATTCATLPPHVVGVPGIDDTSYIQVGGVIAGADTAGRAPGTYVGSLVFTITATY